MDFLNQAIAQVSDLFRSMTPGARITAGPAAGRRRRSASATCSSISRPDRTSSCSAAQYLPDGQLNQIEAAIAKAGLNGHRREGNRILRAARPEGRVSRRRRRWRRTAAQLPHLSRKRPRAKAVRGNRAKPPKSGSKSPASKCSAKSSATWTGSKTPSCSTTSSSRAACRGTKQGHRLGQRQADRSASRSTRGAPTMLQKLVAHAVVGMRAEDVVVTSLGDGERHRRRRQRLSPNPSTTSTTRPASPTSSTRSRASSTRCATSRASASKSAPSSTTRSKRPSRTSSPTSRAPRSRTHDGRRDDADRHRRRRRPAGRHRPRAQSPRRPAATRPAQTRSKTSESDRRDRTTSSARNKRLVRRTGFTPKEDWATVTIPRSYVETIWKQRNPDAKDPPKDEDLRSVQTRPRHQGRRHRRCRCCTRQNKGEDAIQASPRRDRRFDSDAGRSCRRRWPATRLAWIGRYWTTLAMIGVAMFSLLVLRVGRERRRPPAAERRCRPRLPR